MKKYVSSLLFLLTAAVWGFAFSAQKYLSVLPVFTINAMRGLLAAAFLFLAIPVMLGASLLKCAKAFILDKISITSTELVVLIVGTLTAFLVSLVVVKFLMSFVKRHSFEAFGWYRIAIGVILIIYALVKYL